MGLYTTYKYCAYCATEQEQNLVRDIKAQHIYFLFRTSVCSQQASPRRRNNYPVILKSSSAPITILKTQALSYVPCQGLVDV